MRKLLFLLLIGTSIANAQCDDEGTIAIEIAANQYKSGDEVYKMYQKTGANCFFFKDKSSESFEYTIEFVDGWFEDYYAIKKRMVTKNWKELYTWSKETESGDLKWTVYNRKSYIDVDFATTKKKSYGAWEEVAKENTPAQAKEALKLLKRFD